VKSIQNIGYAPFRYVTNSDHRPLFVAFTTTKLFGDETDMMHAAAADDDDDADVGSSLQSSGGLVLVVVIIYH
jgi:hypothetical protein